MKTKIPLSVSHPHLHAQRQQHLKPYNDAAGLIVACLIGLPLLVTGLGFIVFMLLGVSAR